MAHTPGPWVADAISEQGDVRVACVNMPLVIASVHNGASIVEVLNQRHPSIQWANARLIAAAPDLLAACKEARFRLFGTGPAAQPLAYQLDAAIAKAETV